jgi:hypothetical protein
MGCMIWERIYTENEHYDGPVFGIADYRGAPHVYDREWHPSRSQYGPRCRLSPIDPDLLAIVFEDWEIWRRWDAARREGRLSVEIEERVLPEDWARHEAISIPVGDRLEKLRGGPIEAIGQFRVRDGAWWVRWRS